MFDLTRISSFNNLDSWVGELHRYVETMIPFIIIGNKRDLEHIREVEREAALKYSEKWAAPYLETSAKTGEGVDKCFTSISIRLLGEFADYNVNC
ncbi:MAG: GTP-binding protein [Candidatus Odinarchaeum yellowstonii]|uniref:GTP-binding protein n=1 Tax=Odinarchaeota yellowstonii (strain LCB_4) TaxID=1841599 RepID=A0AAF0IBH2_ODILC|nr:MAG: GTP-binding protein [Candidatus Odinarchaeum yellowstonii]